MQRQLHEEPETGQITTTQKAATVVQYINSYKHIRQLSRIPIKQPTCS